MKSRSRNILGLLMAVLIALSIPYSALAGINDSWDWKDGKRKLKVFYNFKDDDKLGSKKNIPASPSREGTVITAPPDSLLLRVGVWLMPDNQLPGILEDFLRFLVPPRDNLLVHADEAIDTIPAGQLKFADLKKPKARIHTWLAWQEEPGKPFGQAISARYLDPCLPAHPDSRTTRRRH